MNLLVLYTAKKLGFFPETPERCLTGPFAGQAPVLRSDNSRGRSTRQLPVPPAAAPLPTSSSGPDTSSPHVPQAPRRLPRSHYLSLAPRLSVGRSVEEALRVYCRDPRRDSPPLHTPAAQHRPPTPLEPHRRHGRPTLPQLTNPLRAPDIAAYLNFLPKGLDALGLGSADQLVDSARQALPVTRRPLPRAG